MSSPAQSLAHHWNRRLRCFRFHFAHGGHANDMDTLAATARFSPGEAGLIELFAKLGIPLVPIAPGTPVEEPGRSYDSSEWNKVAHPIREYPRFHSPTFVSLSEVPAYLSVSKDQLSILLSGASGEPWQIDEADFRNAERLEELLPARGVRLTPRAAIADTEELYFALRERGMVDWVTHSAARAELVRKGVVAAEATDPAVEMYRLLRAELAPAWPSDESWDDAHRELQAIAANAAAVDANSTFLAHRFPGYSSDLLERVCADLRFALR